MILGDRITLVNKDGKRMSVVVADESPTHILVHTSAAPLWFRAELQCRGVFIGPQASWHITLFKGHDGTWVDTNTLKTYTIREDE